MKSAKRVLDNGMTVIYERRMTDSVAIEILVRVGSDFENDSNRGISHFVEHMVFEGTKSRGARELAEEIESTGGEINAATYQDKTSYYAVVPKKYFIRALDVLADILINPSFESEKIEKEKRVALDELTMLEDDPLHFSFKNFMLTLFEKLPARYLSYGTRETIRGLTKEQVLNYFREHYAGKNIIVSIAGDVRDPFNAVKKFFEKMPRGTRSLIQLPKEPEQGKHKIKRFKRDTQHAYVVCGFKAAKILDRDYYTLEVIKAILAKGQSSRLFNEARTKRGLCYVISAVNEANMHCGFFAVFFTCEKTNVEKVLKIVEDEIKLNGLDKKELRSAKDFLIGSFLIANERTKDRAEENAFWHLFNKKPSFYIRGIRRVSVRDVKTCIRKYFKKHTIVITSP